MAVPGLSPAFCTVAYADSVCDGGTVWDSKTDDQKESALQYGRVYIEDNYYCNFDSADAPLNVQTGSALLAEKHLASSIFDAQDASKPAQGLTATSVDAKGVKAGKNWDPYVSKMWKDPFPEVTAILQLNGYCTLKKGGVRVVPRS